jgi:hypothetical protein
VDSESKEKSTTNLTLSSSSNDFFRFNMYASSSLREICLFTPTFIFYSKD